MTYCSNIDSKHLNMMQRHCTFFFVLLTIKNISMEQKMFHSKGLYTQERHCTCVLIWGNVLGLNAQVSKGVARFWNSLMEFQHSFFFRKHIQELARIYDASTLQLESCIHVRHVSVFDTLGYFIDIYQWSI